MKILREIYDFVTGGSIAAPIGVACAIAAALFLPVWRAPAFVTLVALAFVASVFERPT